MAKGPPTVEQIIKLKHTLNPPLSIIPLLVRSKMPARKWVRVINGDPFADHELVDMWSTEVNPGIATGRFSAGGLAVVDADNQRAIDWVDANLPHTHMQTATRPDGRHFVYRLESGLEERVPCGADVLGSKARFLWQAKEELGLDLKVRQWKDQTESELADEQQRVVRETELASTKLEMGPIIDIRADGGQVVAPGAVRADGRVYAMVEPWTQRMFDEDVPFFSWDWFEGRKWRRPGAGPAKVADLAAKRGEKELERARDQTPDMRLKRARAWLEHVEGAVSGQGGHNKTFYAANRLVTGFCIDADTAYQMLKDDYNPRCQPAWSDEELAHKIVGAVANSGQNDGYMLVDRPGFRSKVHEHQVWEASADDFELDDLIPGPPAGGGAPPQSAPPGQLDEDDKYWMRRWDLPFGVDYLRLKADKVFFARVKENGLWIIPATTENLSVVLRYSRFVNSDLKFNQLKLIVEDRGQRIDDRRVLLLKSDMDKMWNGKDIFKQKVQDAVDLVAAKRHYEPVQEWLLALPAWDGVKRLATAASRVLGSKDTDVNGHMFVKWMTGLAARIMDPGVKMDTMLILVSRNQGAGKSKFLRLLIDGHLKGDKWFTDNPFSLKDKDGKMLIGTNILVEWSESEHAKSAKMIDTVKAFLSAQEDEFREPYARHVMKRPRRCVFSGTSNDIELLHDPSGDRRFFIIETASNIDLKTLKAEREQWFAEALDVYRRHVAAAEESEPWHATRWWFTADEDRLRQSAMQRFQSRSAWFEDIAQWLYERAGDKEPRFRIGEVVEDCLKVTRDKKSKKIVEDVRRTLLQLGCECEDTRSTIGGQRARRWRPPAAHDLEDTLSHIM